MKQLRRIVVAGTAALVSVLWWSTSGADLMDWIFADSFEVGGVSAWSWSNGPYTVIPEAASEGDYGLRVFAIMSEPAWVQDDNPVNEGVVRTDFDLNADNLTMVNGHSFDIYVGWVVDDTSAAFLVSLAQVAGQKGLRLTAKDNTGGSVVSPVIGLPGPGWHSIGIEYGAGTGPKSQGEMRLFINGILEAELIDFDNDGVLVESLRLGVVSGVDTGTSGSIDLDVYTSVRLFDPWPCSQSSSGDPTDTSPVCLDGRGRSTSVAAGGCGDGVVVWRGVQDLGPARSRLGGIYGSSVSSAKSRVGTPFLIVQDEHASTPDVDMDGACRSVVVWRSFAAGEAIFAGLFAADGTPLVTPVSVASVGGLERGPVVAVNEPGEFLVVWRHSIGPEQAIWGRFFDDAVAPVGSAFQIDGGGAGLVSEPAVAMNDDGFAVVVWESLGAIHGRLFDDSGTMLGLVTLSTGPTDGEPSVGMTGGAGFVVSWKRAVTDSRIYMQLFDSDGAPVSVATRVDTLSPADCSEPQVSVGAGDGFVVVWSSLYDGVRSIRGRRFTAGGDPEDAEFEIESSGAVWAPMRPRIAVSDRLLVSFSERTEPFSFARGALIGAKMPAAIFTDGFEGGDTSAWSNSIP